MCCGIKSETQPQLWRNLLYFFPSEQSGLFNLIVKLRCLLSLLYFVTFLAVIRCQNYRFQNSYNDNNSVIKFKCSSHVMTAWESSAWSPREKQSTDENERRLLLTSLKSLRDEQKSQALSPVKLSLGLNRDSSYISSRSITCLSVPEDQLIWTWLSVVRK